MNNLFLGMLLLQPVTESGDVGSLVRSLWLIQRYGTLAASDPANDARTKGALAKAVAKDSVITFPELEALMNRDVFSQIAGADGKIDAAELARALEVEEPESRKRLNPKLRAYADYLSTTFDMIEIKHWQAGHQLATWIAANYTPGKPLDIIVVCTGNTRRSVLGSSMGNLAAAYCGLPSIRVHSGGTAPTAVNPRTITTLRSIGFQIEPTGEKATRGEPQTENPVYRLSWGDGLEMREFSKHYADQANPQGGFAALLVCSEADEGCPLVKGATLRVATPFLDPKIYDDGAYEPAKYAERRDDIGRLLLAVMVQARRQIASSASAGQ